MLSMLLASSLLATQKVRSDAPIDVNILVVNYDPIIEVDGGKRLHEAMGWNDPRELVNGTIADIAEASGGFVHLVVKEWRDLDEWPLKKDGFRYTDKTYLDVMRRHTAEGHQPDEADYERMVADAGVAPRIDSGEIDEFWIMGFPYAGFWESAMGGPGAFWINGGIYDKIPTKKPFAIMGYSFERGVAEMVHNTSHRAENHLARVYGRWQAGVPGNMWEKFSAHELTSPGYASVGNCHFPPNAESDYDYGNSRVVQSIADDWANYPHFTGAKKPVSKDTWGGPDDQRNYLKWWFGHMPKKPGTTTDGRQMNWWKYIYRFNDYTPDGLPKKVRF